MFEQLFGNYLVRNRALSKAELDDILSKQSKTRVRLGVIAVAKKLLTEEQKKLTGCNYSKTRSLVILLLRKDI